LRKKGLEAVWKNFPEDWEVIPQKDLITEYLLSGCSFDDPIWLLNDSCYEEKGMPYFVKKIELEIFLSAYESSKGGMTFIDGDDQIIICPQINLVGLRHHSGYYTSINYDD